VSAPDFGVVIATDPGDVHFAKATCESVRQFMPGVPICLVVDGDVPTGALERAYGVTVLRQPDVRDPFLREQSFGFGFTKMVALWEAPFDRFLYLDADTVVWGDVRDNVDVGAADLITSTPHEPNPEAQVRAQYFDVGHVAEHVLPFEWRDRAYFNSGVFVARRGCFSLDLYKRLYAVQHEHLDHFMAGEQGVLNLMAILAQDDGSLEWTHGRLQQLMGTGGLFDGFESPPWQDPAERFRVVDGRPVVQPDDHVVLHWAAGKPSLLTAPPGSELMTHFRREALRRTSPWLMPVADRVLRAEEQTWVARRALRKGPRHMADVVAREAGRAAGRFLRPRGTSA
jgi:hypothetical protein